jgi:NADPH:quinone reductase-like Zn-dependent oxidoreductase
MAEFDHFWIANAVYLAFVLSALLGSTAKVIAYRRGFQPMLSPFVGQKLRMLISPERNEDLQSLKELIEASRVTPVIDRTYPLSEAPEAIRYLSEGHARGKVVVTV